MMVRLAFRGRFVWLFLTLAVQLAFGSSMAHAVSAACSTLSALDTISYSNTFPAASFSPGETLTVSYTDDGQDPASLPPFASDRVLVQDAGTTNLYGYNYYSSSKINGLRALTITASQLTASGLNLNIQTGTHIGPVAIRCTGSVTAPTVANTASTVAANSSNNAVTLSIGGTATSVAVVSGPAHGAATPSGTSISYTPAPGYYGTDSFTYSASNAGGTSGTATATISVTAPVATLAPGSGPLTPGTVGASYSQIFTMTGGTAPFSYSATGLPAGLNLNPATGLLSGTPTVAGPSTFTIQATDSSNGAGGAISVTQSYSLTIATPTVTVGPVSVSNPTAGIAYSQTLVGAGGAAPYAFAITGGALPAGLSMMGNGTIAGTATAAGGFSFTVTATDKNGFSGSRAYSVTVAPPVITFATTTLGAASVASAYSQNIAASGGNAPYTYSLVGGALPPGISLSAGGTLAGTAASAGTFNFTVQARDSTAGGTFTATQAFTLTVGAATLAVAPASLTGATVGVASNQTITASGGVAPYTFAITAGSLPAGMTLSSGGALSGTPTAGGSFSFTVTATDSSGGSGPFSVSRNYTLAVAAATLSLSPAMLPPPSVGAVYSQTLTASGGVAPYTYAVTAGALPAGLILNSSTGVISGTPTVSGSSSFTIQAKDSSVGVGAPFSIARTFSLSTGQGIPTAPGVVVATNPNTPVTIHAAANAANGPFTGVVVVTPPASGSVAVQGLDIVYTPASTSSGAITFAYALVNAAGQSAPVPVTVNVAAMPIPVASAQASAAAGKVASVNITENATGGPFTGAAIVSVVPEYAGEAKLSRIAPKTVASANVMGGAPGSDFVVTFTPAAAFAGTAVITYTISNAVAISNPAELRVTVAARKDPSTDPDVTGLINAQIQAARRFASAQISNYNQRLEQLHGKGRPTFRSTLNVALPRADGVDPRVCQGIDGLAARDECQRGAAMVRDANAGNPGAAQADAAKGIPELPGTEHAPAGNPDDARLAFWTAGTVDFGFANVAAQRSGFRFTTGGVTAGADYRVSDQLTAGFGMGYGHDATEVGSYGTHSNADAFSVALYGSYRPAPSYFIDGVAGYGVLDFDSRRWVADEAVMATGKRDGHQWFASLTSGYEHRGAKWLISPYGRVSAMESGLDAFTESGAGTNALTYFGQTVTSVSGTLGLRTEYVQPTRWGTFTPFGRIEYQHDFEGQGAANLSYADLVGVGQVYSVKGSPFGRDRFQVWLGGKMRTKTVTFGLDYNVMFGMSGLQQGVRLTFAAPF
ncbi:putative Ig domain-containing protein [Cupriavidus pauculus]|uniref:putative Ig domain-containing protein n=1 Tax=Cupriavidus pauculus TaxID=82633 RepID=UPI001FD040D6|nr:putative Ig domain-containing protein [Cupriavidus pauculus]